MARSQTLFVCRECGGEALKWQGQCAHCKDWDTLERVTAPRSNAARGTAAHSSALEAASLTAGAQPRMSLRLAELDRVFGGGLVPGSVTLLGGEPGIGKSTLLLQVAATLSQDLPIVYASGEESVAQVALRAQRLGLTARSSRWSPTARSMPSCSWPPNGAARCWSSTRSSRCSWTRSNPAPARRCSCANAPPRWCALPRAGMARGHHRRPRHQGRQHRRAEAARAHGRYGAVFRQRCRQPLPAAARHQEPLRAGQ